MDNSKKPDTDQNKAEAFEDILIAAMLDAALERKLTQLKATITPKTTGRATTVRIIVVPDQMDVEWPQGLENTRSSKANQKPFERTS